MTRDILLPSGLSVELLRLIQAPMVTFAWSRSAPHRLSSNVQSSDSVRSRSLLRRRPMVGSRPRPPSEASSWDPSLPRSRDCSDRPLSYLYIYSSLVLFTHSIQSTYSLPQYKFLIFIRRWAVCCYLPKSEPPLYLWAVVKKSRVLSLGRIFPMLPASVICVASPAL
jgi:hypothetical protein